MGNSPNKQRKLQIFKKIKVRTSSYWKDTVCLIISHWARNNGLYAISFQHITSILVMTIIQRYSKQDFCLEIAEKILSLNKLTTKQIKKYALQKPKHLQTFITKENILYLCDEIIPTLEKDEILLKLNLKKNTDQKLIIFGDIRGHLFSLFRHFHSIHQNDNDKQMNIMDKIHKYNDIFIFLGSYVSRGQYSIECICLLYCLKLMFPENIYLLRGFQETAPMARIYGFYDEFKRCYPKTESGQSQESGISLWKRMKETFNWMPFASLINNKWFAVHGGLSPELKTLDVLYDYERPLPVPDTGLLCDLLWTDPERIVGWGEMGRSVSYIFGPDIVNKWLTQNNLDLIVRAHQICEDGFEWFIKDKLVTVFSCADFCGEFDNDGAIMIVDSDLEFRFSVIKAQKKSQR